MFSKVCRAVLNRRSETRETISMYSYNSRFFWLSIPWSYTSVPETLFSVSNFHFKAKRRSFPCYWQNQDLRSLPRHSFMEQWSSSNAPSAGRSSTMNQFQLSSSSYRFQLLLCMQRLHILFVFFLSLLFLGNNSLRHLS